MPLTSVSSVLNPSPESTLKMLVTHRNSRNLHASCTLVIYILIGNHNLGARYSSNALVEVEVGSYQPNANRAVFGVTGVGRLCFCMYSCMYVCLRVPEKSWSCFYGCIDYPRIPPPQGSRLYLARLTNPGSAPQAFGKIPKTYFLADRISPHGP